MKKYHQKVKNEEVEQNCIVYSIDTENKTASVIRSPKAEGNIIIPRSIIHKSTEYIITSISKYAFTISKINFLQFPSDSELQTIENKAFYHSTIKMISIPSSVTELKEGWCEQTSNLNKIIINPNNKRYICLDEKYIIGKSSIENENYEDFIFAIRNIKIVNIPNFIKCIKSFSLNECKCLQSIEIPIDSQLQTIENKAFSFSSIESLTIPSNLTDLKEGWCNVTEKLTYVNVSPNNPRYLSDSKHKYIIGKSSIENDDYDVFVFCARDVETMTIPSFIKRIAPNAFHLCHYIYEIEIPSDSKLEIIDNSAFANSSIFSLKIPSSLQRIGERAFIYCDQFQSIEIPIDSELKTIEKDAFYDCPIVEFTIPSKLVDLNDGWCESMEYLMSINVSQNNPRYSMYDDNKLIIGKSSIDINEYDTLILCVRNVDFITIPSFIKFIGASAFDRCTQLKSVFFEKFTKLKEIGKNAFFGSMIESFTIPSSVTKICEYAFDFCDNLKKVEISENSELQIIDKYAFSESPIKSIIIPPLVSHIGEYAFSFCNQLQIFQIDENSILEFIDINIFNKCESGLVMIPTKLNIYLVKND